MGHKRHAIRTDNNSIWINFEGDVPRVGDEISLSVLSSSVEDLSPEQKDASYIVTKVRWIPMAWREEPHPSTNHNLTVKCDARVTIKEIKKES